MAQVCKVCSHPNRYEIDAELASGRASVGSIAKRFGVPVQSAHRHKAKHLPKLLTSLTTEVEAFKASEVLGQVVGLYERSLELLSLAESRLLSDHRPSALSAAVRAIREARQTVELMSNLSIEMQKGKQEEATRVENTANVDLDAAIADALARRGVEPQGERAHASSAPYVVPAFLALPASHDEVVDAEIVED